MKRWDFWPAATFLAALAAMMLSFLPGWLSYSVPESLPPVITGCPAPAAEGVVNVNTAGTEELTTLPGIGRARAQAIIQYLEDNGPFGYPEDLAFVPGIGEDTLDGLLDRITTGGDSYAENTGG